MHKQILMAAMPLFALMAAAQQLPLGYPSQANIPQQQGQGVPIDCSDPTMAETAQCSFTQGLGMTSGGMQMPGVAGAGMAGSPSLLVPTYTDEGGMQNARRQRARTIQLRPEPLTEFQKFVASTTGQVLPIYGASLFQNVPSTFAPVENTPVPPDYVVGPDDELRIRIWGQVNFNANVRVHRSGDIFLPQVGAVHVAGLRFDEIQQHLHDAVGKVYRNFQLDVEMGQIRTLQVYVTGEARRAGMYTVSSLATMVDALFASGGPSVQGSLRHIELRRSGQTVTTLDLYALLVNGDKSKDMKLLPGDVIFIPPVGAQAALMGSVRRAGIYELLPGETVENALHDAGGLSSLASSARAEVDRTSPAGRQAMEIRLDAGGMATTVENGDIVNVLSLVTRFEKTVTLRGNTANPGRFAWHEGMKLSDLIPDRESLLTRDYWWKRARMGLPAPEFEPAPALADMRQPSGPVNLREQAELQQQALQQQKSAANPQSNGNAQGQAVASSEDAYLMYGAAGQTGTAGGAQAGAAGANASESPAAEGQKSALADEGEEENAPVAAPATRRTVVKLNVPEIDWSYAVIERTDATTLQTKLVPFDLGKLVNGHDASQDLALQPGDIVTVFSQADIHVPIAEQTTFVRLEGEFVHSGTYSVKPGESLRSLVERAGGLSPNAYLYGSVFTRESTRILQQRRIDESVQEMTLQMQRGLLALAASPVTNAQDLASVNSAQSSEQALIAQLKQIRANGRIVFGFTPQTKGDAAIPDIPLENGDAFLVPSVPTTVNVMGAVFNQNSFVYRPHGEVKGFLDLAGGPNSDADRKRMFVVRANGAVVSRTVVKSAWTDAFMHLKLYPGDTVIVPEKSIKPSALRGVLDWTQIFSQLAFGAAAINVLR